MSDMVERVVQTIQRNTRRGRNGAYVTDIPALARQIVEAMEETSRLLSSPTNAARLAEAIAQLDAESARHP